MKQVSAVRLALFSSIRAVATVTALTQEALERSAARGPQDVAVVPQILALGFPTIGHTWGVSFGGKF